MKKPPVKIHRNLLRPEKKICARLYGVGIPAALNMALPSLLISALNAILASISETGVTILGIYYKLQTFLYLSVNGMIQGMRPIIGYNYGAKEYKRVNKIYNLALMIAFGIMAVGTALFMFTPETFMKMFTTRFYDHSRCLRSSNYFLRFYRFFRICCIKWSFGGTW